jgi:membrane protein CcdC involved in cytochrome C biogenesis
MNIDSTATVIICMFTVVAVCFGVAYFVYEARNDEVHAHGAAGAAFLLTGLAFLMEALKQAITSVKSDSDPSFFWWMAALCLVGGVALSVVSFRELRSQLKAPKNA